MKPNPAIRCLATQEGGAGPEIRPFRRPQTDDFQFRQHPARLKQAISRPVRQMYSAGLTFPSGVNVFKCETTAPTENGCVVFSWKLLFRAVQMTASTFFVRAQAAVTSSVRPQFNGFASGSSADVL
jgi:hypothetical protein